jgi:UDP-N-acetylmuramate--alanine ligase
MIDVFKRVLPIDWGTIYFIGIGGIGMSGLAEILHNLGYKVCGSDLKESYVTKRLQKLGIPISFDQQNLHTDSIGVVVKSTAIADDHPQLIKAIQSGIPVVDRAQMLAELMRLKYSLAVSGTHGKTTTTSMIAHMLESAALNPTVINGGVINKVGTNAYFGSGDFLVAEADESDGTFIRLPIYAAVITNINPEHLSYYKTFDKVKDAYLQFIHNVPFYGFALVCFDCPTAREVANYAKNRHIISYAIDCDTADLRAHNITYHGEGVIFDVLLSPTIIKQRKLDYTTLKKVKLGVIGKHNILNALAAIGAGIALGIKPEVICASLANFSGVKRRFTKVAEINEAIIIDDYAHHPVEISATLSAAKTIAERRNGRVIAIMQPHRYTRFNDLFADFAQAFNDADQIFVTPVYAAGELPIGEASIEKLVDNLKCQGKQAFVLYDLSKARTLISNNAQKGDIVLFLGAGDITNYANNLLKNNVL